MPGTSVVRALAAATNSRATSPGSDAASFDYFSTLSIGFDNSTGRFTSRSFLTPLNQRAEALRQEREVVLSIASTTNGSSNFVLGADGSVTGPQGQYGLSGSSYAIPATVPLDTTLVQYAATQGNGVRLFVGSIPDRPDQMRVCWNIDVPSALRVTCSRNLRSTGEPVGVDAVNDLSGTILTHASTDREPVRFTVLGCYAKEIEANVRTEGWVFRERWYDRTKSYGGILSEPWPYGPITVTRSGNRETVDYMTPRSTERHVVEDGVRIVEADSIVSGGTYSADIRCVEFGG